MVDEVRRVPPRALPAAPEPGDRTGAFLRAWRELRGWSIDQVAWALRIRLVYLEAIEEDRFDDLPGSIYVTGFARSYARLLGLDDGAVVRHLRTEYPELDRRKALIFPEPPAERAVPGGALTAIGIAVAMAVYGGWYYQSATSLPDPGGVASVPSRLIATADPAGQAFRESDEGTLPATVPMQPPMRLPPTRTVVPPSAPGMAGNSSGAPVDVAAIPAPLWPESGPPADAGAAPASIDATARTQPIPRGAPPEPGAAPSLEVALADAGRLPGGEAHQRASAGAAGGAGDASAMGSGGDGIYRAPPRVEIPAPGMAATPQRMPAPPALPSAEVADAYAASLPANMIPLMRERGAERLQSASSASAAWASSVDGMPAGQWRQPALAPGQGPESAPVVLNAVEATWIEVREETGQMVTGKLLQPGESYTVPQRSGLKLTTGNAGGLEILVGGRSAPRVGPRGAVRRNIDLDGALLLAGRAQSD